MFKRGLVAFLAALMVLGAASSAFAATRWFAAAPKAAAGQAKKAKNVLEFDDLEDAPWAKSILARMRAKNIINGYADGTYKPNSSVSQTEAVVMVIRMKGTATEQAAVALANQNLDLPGIQAVWWANGHIAYALQQGWIEKADFKPNAAASREWVAKLLVKALVADWPAQVVLHANDVLAIKDASKIGKAELGFVAVAIANGWMIGYPDGEFKPNRSVSRAEMAALLERGQGTVPGTNQLEVRGTITAIDLTVRKLTVTRRGTAQSFTVSADALIYLEDSSSAAALTDLKVGDELRAIMNASGVAVVITVDQKNAPQTTTPPTATTSTITGTLRAVAVSSTSTTLTVRDAYGVDFSYPLASGAIIRANGVQTTASQLALSSSVTITVSNGQILTVDSSATTTATISGTIQLVENLGTYYLTVRDAYGVSFRYPVASAATITINGVTTVASQLLAGQTVTINVTTGQITSCVATGMSVSTASGTILGLSLTSSPSSITMAVYESTGVNTLTYGLASTCRAFYLSSEIGLAALQVSDKATLTKTGDYVTSINVTERAQVTTQVRGTIQLVESGSTVYLTIRDSSNASMRYPLAASATLTSGTVPIVASQLVAGLTVQVTVVNGQITVLAVVAP